LSTTEPGWVGESRPVPEALTDTFEDKHITGWASFLELCDPESGKRLSGFMSAGEPTP